MAPLRRASRPANLYVGWNANASSALLMFSLSVMEESDQFSNARPGVAFGNRTHGHESYSCVRGYADRKGDLTT